MNFVEFKKNLKKEAEAKNYTLSCPYEGDEEMFIWIYRSDDKIISNKFCHYEFVIDEKYLVSHENCAELSNFTINLEMHFESELSINLINNFYPKILNKTVKDRYKDHSNKNQRGIVYKQFKSNDPRLIKKCLKAVVKMDRKIKKYKTNQSFIKLLEFFEKLQMNNGFN